MFCFLSFFILLHALALQVGFSRGFTIDVPETVQGVAQVTWTRTSEDADNWALNLTDAQSGVSVTLSDPGKLSTPFDLAGQLEVPIEETGKYKIYAINPNQPNIWFAESNTFLSLPVGSSVSASGPPSTTSSIATGTPTSSSAPGSTDPKEKQNANLASPTRNAIIAGATIAAVIFILLVVAATVLYTRSRKPDSVPRMSFYRDKMVRGTPMQQEAGSNPPSLDQSTSSSARLR